MRSLNSRILAPAGSVVNTFQRSLLFCFAARGIFFSSGYPRARAKAQKYGLPVGSPYFCLVLPHGWRPIREREHGRR